MSIVVQVAAGVLLLIALWLLGAKKGNLPSIGRLLSFGRPGPRKERALAALEQVRLTPQHAIHLVRFRGQLLIVATHAGGCSLLHSDPDARDECRANKASA